MEQIYNPGAGHLPPAGVLPGREQIIAAWEAMLTRVGTHGRPRAKDLILTGNRGIGKSATMKTCVHLAENQGYLRLSFQATEDTTLSAALLEGIRAHAPEGDTFWTRAIRALSRISGAGIGLLGASASVEIEPPAGSTGPGDPYNATAIGNAIGELADQIKKHHQRGGIVLAIDEFQAAAGPDIKTIGAILNHLNNWHSTAPVLFIAAGLPSTMNAMIGPDPEHPRISNPARLFVVERPSQYLTRDQVELALRAPAKAAGGDWHQDAVDRVYTTTRGYPAHLQSVAAAAWAHATGPTVLDQDVLDSLPAARADVDRMYNESRWDAMGPVQRAYIAALALCGGEARSGKVAAMINRTTSGASPTRDALIRRGDVFSVREGWVALAQPLMADFAPLAYRDTHREKPDLPSLTAMARVRDTYQDARERPSEPELTDDEVRALLEPRDRPPSDDEATP